MSQPRTSIAANEAVKPAKRERYNKILAVMQKLPKKEGVSDTIAAHLQYDKVEVGRRLSEMSELKMVVKTTRTGITAKGCKAAIWQVVETPIETVQQTLF